MLSIYSESFRLPSLARLRETAINLELDETEIVVDELPFGLFMEIEGLENDIAQVERKLGAELLEAVEETYPTLTRQYGKANGEVIEARFPKLRCEVPDACLRTKSRISRFDFYLSKPTISRLI